MFKNPIGILAILASSFLTACPTAPSPIITELIVNGGFETNMGWRYSSNKASRGTQAYCAKNGVAYGALSTQGEFAEPDIGQDFIIPNKGTTILEFSVRVDTLEDVGTSANSFKVFVGSGEALAGSTITTGDTRDRYLTRKIDITNRKGTTVNGGQEVAMYLKADFKGSKPSVFCIDDVSVINTQ